MYATDPAQPFKKNIAGLVNLIRQNPDINSSRYLDALENHLKAFPRYVDAIWQSEHMTTLAYIRYSDDQDLLHDRIETYDLQRKNAHNSMVTACNVINRMCEQLNTPHFCPELEHDAGGDHRVHRKLCADFCGDIVLEVYEGRDGAALSAERQAKIKARGDLMATPHFDKAAQYAQEHNGLDPNEMSLEL